MIVYQQVSNDNEPPSYQEATAVMLQCDVMKLSFETPPPCLFLSGYAEMEAQFAWDDKTIRRTFIRKVYAILMVQLFVTVGVVGLFTFCEPVRFFIQTHPGLYSASYLMFLATYIALSCCGDLRRQFPWNIILLVLFVSNMHFYNTKSVVLCLGITALVCLSVTIFSFQSKIDVTSCQGVLFSLCMVMLICAIAICVVVPFGYVPWLHATYAVIGAILFTLFLAFDTQMLLGNKRYAISPEEYIFATLSLYLDIIYLFSFLLQIMGEGRE
uniref:Protein lifeguard 2 n=1 Tax=Oreochromis niloticus TaxID=8128 RepID=I3KSM7_ORENI